MEKNCNFIEKLRELGLRPTKQRVKMCEVLFNRDKTFHFTINDLVKMISEEMNEKISLATVYNTLHTFCNAGLVQEITVDGSKSYFDTRTNDHPHFYWEDDQKLTDAPADQLKISELPNAPKGAEIASVDVIIRLRRK